MNRHGMIRVLLFSLTAAIIRFGRCAGRDAVVGS
jgi:hypothetical protein